MPAAALPRLRRLSDPDVLPDDRGAARHADAAGLSRRGRDGQLLEADRAAQGHLPHHRADRGRGADAAQGRRRRLQPAPRDQRLGRDAGRALPPLRGGDRRQGDGGLRHDRGDLPRLDQPARRRAQDRQRRLPLPLHRRAHPALRAGRRDPQGMRHRRGGRDLREEPRRPRRRLHRPGAQPGRRHRGRLSAHRRPRAHRRRRLHLDHRPRQGPHHPRRAQHRPGADRGRDDAPPGGRLRRRDRPARRPLRRAAGGLCRAGRRRRRQRGGADGARPRPYPGAGGGAEAPRDPARAAEDRRRQGLQARPAPPRHRAGLRRRAGRGGERGAGGRGGRGPPPRPRRRGGAGPGGRATRPWREVLGRFTVPWRWRDAGAAARRA